MSGRRGSGDLLLDQLSGALGTDDLDGGRDLGGPGREQLPDVERQSDLESVFEAIGEQPVLGRAVAAAELVGGRGSPDQGNVARASSAPATSRCW
jgi:hypothetical protein